MLRKVLITYISLVFVVDGRGLTPAASAQSTIPRNQRVTIEFVRFDEKTGIITFGMRNQTAWDIKIPSDGFGLPSNQGENVAVRYYLEEYAPSPFMQIITAGGEKIPPDEPQHPAVPKIRRGDIVASYTVRKNERIVFEVPKEHVARNIALYVDFRYEWEDLQVEILTGPVHRVYFRGIDLPQTVQSKIK